MEKDTLQKIKDMDDFQVLRFFNYLNNSLASSIETDTGALLNALPSNLEKLDEMQDVLKLEEKYDTQIDQRDAVDFARSALEVMATNDATEPQLTASLSNYEDNEMAAGVILALGGAVSFIVLLATHKLSYTKKGGWKLEGRNSDEIKGVTGLVKVLIKGIPDAVLKLIKK